MEISSLRILVKNIDMAEADPQFYIVIQSCSAKQLADSYGVSVKVLRTWLKAYPHLKRERRKKYNIEELLFIIENIGMPFKINS